MDLKGIGSYKSFGLRQEFLDYFFTYGEDCFKNPDIQQMLGKIQNESLEVWAKQSGLIFEGKETPLKEKLAAFGAYNPFTWSIIWANLMYTSSICKWFCYNIEAGTSFDKGQIIDLLDNSFSERHRKNGAGALMELLTKSPIGTALGQGIAISKTAYLRDGWGMPDGVALLYSLYLYAEHTNHHKFTLTELYKAHENPEAVGVSPGDIYGLDQKKLRECIQGLALAYPDKIRVSFINDLDNIVLEESVSSLSILDLAEE